MATISENSHRNAGALNERTLALYVGYRMRFLLYLVSYAGLTAITVYLAGLVTRKWRPLPFTEFYLSNEEIFTVAAVLGLTTFFFVGLGRLIARPIESARKFSLDYFNYLLAYTVTILYFLLASSITFNPNLFVVTGAFSIIAALLVHLIFIEKTRNIFFEVLASIKDLFRRGITLYGVFVLLLFMTPMVLAVGFMFSRDVADTITEIRLKINKAEGLDWVLIPAMEKANFQQPMIARFTEQESNTLYMLERSGKVYSIEYPSGGNKELVLDLEEKLGLVDLENGALGFALHPEYSVESSSSYRAAYVYYTAVHNDEQKNIVSKFTLNGSLEENSRSEQRLMVLERGSDAFHNGGSLEFGPDGFLYIALGEGIYKDYYDRDATKTLRAGILRIDVDMRGGNISSEISATPSDAQTANYFIPKDNPFVGNDGALDEYWVLGLRNPFRISFDSKDGTLWAGDVGSAVWEEINKITKGSNYLFPHIEGPELADFVLPEDLVGEPKHPYYTYKHSAFDRTVIGGVVYSGNEFPELEGTYIFADNFSGKMFGISATAEYTEEGEAQLMAQAQQYAQRGISSITYGPEGEVFVTVLGTKGTDAGKLLKLTSVDNQNNAIQENVSEENHVYSVAETKSVYLEMCARCHGAGGAGKGPDSKAFDVVMANFTDAGYSRSYEEIQNIITNGGEVNNLSPHMPAWGSVLSDNEVRHLIQYIESLND